MPSRPWVQQSRRNLTITEHSTGIPALLQESASDTPTPIPYYLSCQKARPAASATKTNCRKIQHWTDNLETRLAAHSRGQGARLLAVIRAHGIGWQLARTWTGTRSRERALKNQGGASRRCPGCGVTPRTGQVMLPRNADGSLSRLRTTDAQKHAAGVMTSAQQAGHTALRPRPGENRAGKARALLIDLSPWEVA